MNTGVVIDGTLFILVHIFHKRMLRPKIEAVFLSHIGSYSHMFLL